MPSDQPVVAYYEAGLDILADLGVGGLKLAELCRRLKVTTGAFYHYFDNWNSYTESLLEYWLEDRTARLFAAAGEEHDPRARLDRLVHIGLGLPHRAESAIRTWSGSNPVAKRIQETVDTARFEAVTNAVNEIVQDRELAKKFAHWALYLLVGYEQVSLAQDQDALKWSVQMFLDSLAAQAPAKTKSRR